VTDQSYEQFMKKMIFKPVGINCFDFGKTLRKEQLPNEATYYNFSRGKLKKSIFINEKKDTFPYSGRHNEGWGGAGAWIGSAIDVVKLVNHALCLKSPCLLSKKTLHKMLAYQPLTERKKNFWYGLGWRIQKKRGGLIVYHAGASNGGALSHMVKTDQNVVWSGHFNMRFKDKKLRQEFNKNMWKAVKSIKVWPAHDLFPTMNPKCK
jgi:CubicO group peptidase (beta-lactamase class C family)